MLKWHFIWRIHFPLYFPTLWELVSTGTHNFLLLNSSKPWKISFSQGISNSHYFWHFQNMAWKYIIQLSKHLRKKDQTANLHTRDQSCQSFNSSTSYLHWSVHLKQTNKGWKKQMHMFVQCPCNFATELINSLKVAISKFHIKRFMSDTIGQGGF